MPYSDPGEVLADEFLAPTGITEYRLAKCFGISQRAVGEIVAGTRAITPNTGLRLSRFFGVSDAFWGGLQLDFNVAHIRDEIEPILGKIERHEQLADA